MEGRHAELAILEAVRDWNPRKRLISQVVSPQVAVP
jgi:hypothetical protein